MKAASWIWIIRTVGDSGSTTSVNRVCHGSSYVLNRLLSPSSEYLAAHRLLNFTAISRHIYGSPIVPTFNQFKDPSLMCGHAEATALVVGSLIPISSPLK